VASFSEGEVRHLLANAFFGLIKNTGHGLFSFFPLYVGGRNPTVAVERIKCQLAYFYSIQSNPNPDHIISFHRLNLADHPPPDWASLHARIDVEKIHTHTDRMEKSNAEAFVDFANMDLHIHKILPSATQEEVLFSCCPEAFPGIHLCEKMTSNEAIIIKGCRRFCDYTGYLQSFEFTEVFSPPRPPQDIIAIDAVTISHFREAQSIRDLNKAYLGFKPFNGLKISTGNWGCGMFGGERSHKFLQQICAATAANVALDVSTFGEDDTLARFNSLLEKIHATGATVAEIVGIMLDFKDSPAKFFQYVITKLDEIRAPPQCVS